MNSFTRFAVLTAILAIFLSRLIGPASAQGVPAPVTYSVSQVAPPPSNETFAYPVLQINNSGQVLWVGQGSYRLDNGTWTSVGDSRTSASAMNNAGDIVGRFSFSSHGLDFVHAFLYSGGSRQDLGTYSNGSDSYASAINDNDEVLGWSETNGSAGAQIVYWKDGVFVPISPLPDPPYNVGVVGGAVFINNAGQVAASSFAADGRTHVYFWTKDGKTKDLGVPPAPCNDSATPAAINAKGEVVGYGHNLATAQEHAFLYNGTAMLDIGTLGGDFSRATAINSSGQVVGFSTTATGGGAAFLYQNGIMYDLNSLIPQNSGWSLTEALSINDKGRIVGYGTYQGQGHAFILAPQVAFGITAAKLGLPYIANNQSGSAFLHVPIYLKGTGIGRVTGSWMLNGQNNQIIDAPVDFSAEDWQQAQEFRVGWVTSQINPTISCAIQSPISVTTDVVQIWATGFNPTINGWQFANVRTWDPVGWNGLCLGMSALARSDYLSGRPISTENTVARPTWLLLRWNHATGNIYADGDPSYPGTDLRRLLSYPNSDTLLATETDRLRDRIVAGLPPVVLLKPQDNGKVARGGHAVLAHAAFYGTNVFVSSSPDDRVDARVYSIYDPNLPNQFRRVYTLQSGGTFMLHSDYAEFSFLGEFTRDP